MRININRLIAHCSRCNKILKRLCVQIVVLTGYAQHSFYRTSFGFTLRKFYANCAVRFDFARENKVHSGNPTAILRSIKNLNARMCINPRSRRYFSEPCFFVEILGGLNRNVTCKIIIDWRFSLRAYSNSPLVYKIAGNFHIFISIRMFAQMIDATILH